MKRGIGLTLEEAALVKKYRQIDAIGKEAINAALNALLAPPPQERGYNRAGAYFEEIQQRADTQPGNMGSINFLIKI